MQKLEVKNTKISNRIDQELYKKVSINDLILFSIFSIKKEKCTFEELVRECFSYFPKAFSFTTILEWPDSRKLDRPLRFLRKKKLIDVNPKAYFFLTKSGKKIAEDISKVFRQSKLGI